ncbi:MAG: hypothetical protein WAZ12_01290 [Candidatus Absconditicoccaceae bacterium]
MINFKIDPDGYIIESKFLYSFTQPNKKYINLALNIGEDMVYTKSEYNIINYPGEYDIGGKIITCLIGKDQKLNYLIFVNGKKFGIIQSPDILESDDVGDMEYRLYTNDSVEKKIDQLELEGERVKLEEKIISEEPSEMVS